MRSIHFIVIIIAAFDVDFILFYCFLDTYLQERFPQTNAFYNKIPWQTEIVDLYTISCT